MNVNNCLNNKNGLFEQITKDGKLEIKDLIKGNNGKNCKADQILESKGFQSMLLITPPKIHEFKSPSPSPSPLLDIMHSLNNMLSDDDEKK